MCPITRERPRGSAPWLCAGTVVLSVEVVAVDSGERVAVDHRHADAGVDHQAGEVASVNEDHARRDVVRVVAGLASERRRRNDNALGGSLTVKRTVELLDLGPSDGIRPLLRL